VFVGPRPMLVEGGLSRVDPENSAETVDAYIDGKLCGSAGFEPASSQFGNGDYFAGLIIPPTELVPGCGRGDGTVTIEFRLGDQRAIGCCGWSPGAFGISLVLDAPEEAQTPVARASSGDDPLPWLAGGIVIGVLAGALLTYIVIRRSGPRPVA